MSSVLYIWSGIIKRPNLFASFLNTKLLLFNILGDINITFPLVGLSFLIWANSDKSRAHSDTFPNLWTKKEQNCSASENKFVALPSKVVS